MAQWYVKELSKLTHVSVQTLHHFDIDTVKAVISNRFQILSLYYKQVIKPILQHEKKNQANNKQLFRRAGWLLRSQENLLSPDSKARLQTLLNKYEQLRLVYSFRQSLQNIWLKTAKSQQDITESLQQWCIQAEESSLEVLGQFAKQLKCYSLKNA